MCMSDMSPGISWNVLLSEPGPGKLLRPRCNFHWSWTRTWNSKTCKLPLIHLKDRSATNGCARALTRRTRFFFLEIFCLCFPLSCFLLFVSQDAPGYHANREAIALLEKKDGLPALKKLKQVLPPGCERGRCRRGNLFVILNMLNSSCPGAELNSSDQSWSPQNGDHLAPVASGHDRQNFLQQLGRISNGISCLGQQALQLQPGSVQLQNSAGGLAYMVIVL